MWRCLRQARFALSLGLHGRFMLSVLAAALVWFALFDAAEQMLQIELARAGRGQLGGLPGYTITLARPTSGKDRRAIADLPAEVIELMLERVPAVVFMLSRQANVGNAARDRVWALDLLVSPYLQSQTVPRDFPPCVVLGHQLPLLEERGPLPVDELWRCRPVPLPPELAGMGAQIGHGSLMLSPQDAHSMLGPGWQTQVRSAVAGLASTAPLRRLDEGRRQVRQAGLELRELSERFDAAEDVGTQLEAATQVWRGMALLALPLALGLYAHGVWPVVRREAALRACLGHGELQVGLWFASSWLAQTLGLGFGAWLLATGVHAARGSGLALGERLSPPLLLAAVLFIMAAVGAWLVVARVREPGRMMAWLR